MSGSSASRLGVSRLGVWTWSPHDGWADFCARLFLLLGRDVDADGCRLGGVHALVHADDRGQLDDFVEAVECGDLRDIEGSLRLRGSDGEWRRILTSARRRTADGQVVGVHLDLTDLEKSESHLRRREEDFRRVVEHANEGIGILDEDQTIRFANRHFGEIVGRPANELVGTSLLEHVDPEDWDHLRRQIERRRSGERSRYELRMRRPDGSLRWVRISGAPVFESDHTFRGSFAMMTDVTERLEQERRLRDSERRLSDIVSFLPDPTLVVDDGGHVIAWNRAIEELTGVTAEEIVGKDDYEYALPFYGERRPLLLDYVLDPGLDLSGHYDYFEPAGDTFVAEIHVPGLRPGGADLWIKARRLTDADGAVIGAIETIRDVTQRRAVENRLRESEERYRTLFESAVDAVFLMDGERFVDGNSRTGEIFQATHEELIGCTPFSFSPELQPDGQKSDEKGRRYLEAVLEGEAQVFPWVHQRADGTLFDAEVSLTRVLVDGRSMVLAFVRDVSDRRKAERTRELLERRLRHSQKMEAVGQLAGGVAHDFNNLLQAISGYAELLEQELESEHSALSNVAEISRAVERATSLTRQLLTFSRREELKQEPLFLDELVGDLAKLLRRLIGEHIELSLAPGPGVSAVMADRGQLEQVVLNLCVNARDAMPDGGRVEIETRDVVIDESLCARHPGTSPGAHVLLRVSDNGPGMEESVRERMFEPFFTTKDVGKGTGLGLATAYAVVQRHRGAIECDSEPDEGTTFRIYLPAAEMEVVRREEEKRRRDRVGGHETILVAEDEPAVRTLAETVLRGAGYRVLAAADGSEALRLIDVHASEIDLAILDIVMPHRGGQQVAARLLEDRPELPIIFSSGYALGVRDDRELPGESLPKPYRPSELLERVRAALDRRRT